MLSVFLSASDYESPRGSEPLKNIKAKGRKDGSSIPVLNSDHTPAMQAAQVLRRCKGSADPVSPEDHQTCRAG